MNSGAYMLDFDPDGYDRPQPGLDAEWDGAHLARQRGKLMGNRPGATADSDQPFLFDTDGFHLVEGTPFLLCRPRQLDPDWVYSADLPDCLCTKEKLTWASGIPVDNRQDWKKLETAFTDPAPGNLWIRVNVPASIGTAPINVNWTNFRAATTAPIPAGFDVICASSSEVSALKSPHFGFFSYPQPTDLIVFGWSQFAAILTHRGIAILQTTDDHQTWHFLAGWSRDQSGRIIRGLGARELNTFGPQGTSFGDEHSLMAFPVGLEHVAFYLDLHDPQIVRTRTIGNPETDNPLQFNAGKWWVAAGPHSAPSFQIQSVRHAPAEHAAPGDPTDASAAYFDFGTEGYAPPGAPTPSVPVPWMRSIIVKDPSDPDDEIVTSLPAGQRNESTLYGCLTEYQVFDDQNEPWVSDGVKARGCVHLKAVPASDPDGGDFGWQFCWSPMIALLQLKFPIVRIPRLTIPAQLDDTQWTALSFELGLKDHDAKRGTLHVTDTGRKLLETLEIHKRAFFPVHLLRDVDGDGSYSFLCLRFWVENMHWTEKVWQGGDPENPIRVYELQFRGLIFRVDKSPWWVQAALTATANDGKLLHTDAVKAVLEQTGFDPADPDFVEIATDTAEPGAQLLPPKPAERTNEPGFRAGFDSAPKWTEPKGKYLRRIGETWRGWVFYEKCTVIAYGPEQAQQILDGETLIAQFTLYQTEGDAEGFGAPNQWVVEESDTELEQPSNFVRVITGTAKQPGPHYVIRDDASINDVTAPNFVGEETDAIIIRARMGTTEAAAHQIAWVALRRAGLRRQYDKFPVLLAPWEWTKDDGSDATLDVGGLFALGNGGMRYEVAHWKVDLLATGVARGVLTGELMPNPPAFPVYSP